jgi:CBS domain containing-hemolysin-like protein
MVTAIMIVATVGLMIFINALYVGAEFAVIRVRKTRVYQYAESGNWLAKILLPIKSDDKALDTYLATCQLGITTSSLILGAYGQSTVARVLATMLSDLGDMAVPIAQSISTTVILILFTFLQISIGELLPKFVAIQYPEQMALGTVAPVKWSQIILYPFIWFFNGSGNLIVKLIGLEPNESRSNIHSPGEIELLVTDSHEGGLIDDKERQMLRNAFRLRELIARQVMIPRTRLISACVEDSVTEVLAQAIKVGVSRIPIYKKSIDNIIGFVHVKELFPLHLQGEQNLNKALREIMYVPETMPIADVWQKLNYHRQYMAVVFDEYGGTAGIITFEDLIEEIFGEVEDEFDQEMRIYYYDNQGRMHLSGDLLITDINEYLNLNLPEGETDTLGGFVFSLLGRPPQERDEAKVGDLIIRIEKVTDQRVSEISFQLPAGIVPEIREWEVAPRE